jgi:hypothetical protein
MEQDKNSGLENGKKPLSAAELKEAFDNMTAEEKEAFLKSTQKEGEKTKESFRSKLKL